MHAGRVETSAMKFAQAERREQVLALRCAGKTIGAIAAELQISRSTVHGVLKQSLRESAHRDGLTADELRRIEVERMDQLFEKEVAKDGTGSSLACVRISERKSKLLGLDIADNPARLEKEIQQFVNVVSRAMQKTLLPENAALYDKLLSQITRDFAKSDGVEIVTSSAVEIEAEAVAVEQLSNREEVNHNVQ